MDKKLTEYTEEELENELKLRKNDNNFPKKLDKYDLKDLEEICKEYLNKVRKGIVIGNESNYYIVECAIETIYGEKIWDWINLIQSQCNGQE